jgi:hypothetical protein
MRTYVSDIIPRIQRFSQSLDNSTLLTNKHWIVIDSIDQPKIVYFFKKDNELIISQNGRAERAKWEYLDNNSILIERKDEIIKYKHGFFDGNILALKIEGIEEYAFLVTESMYNRELNSSLSVAEFLNKKYTETPIQTTPQYSVPKYNLRRIAENTFLFGHVPEHYIVEFEDGENGQVFLSDNDTKTYFEGKINGMWTRSQIHYINIDYCIAGLHYYLKTGEILKDGFISTHN